MKHSWDVNIHLKSNVYYCPHLPCDISVSGILSDSNLQWTATSLFIHSFIYSTPIYHIPTISQASGAHTLTAKAGILSKLHPCERGAQSVRGTSPHLWKHRKIGSSSSVSVWSGPVSYFPFLSQSLTIHYSFLIGSSFEKLTLFPTGQGAKSTHANMVLLPDIWNLFMVTERF